MQGLLSAEPVSGRSDSARDGAAGAVDWSHVNRSRRGRALDREGREVSGGTGVAPPGLLLGQSGRECSVGSRSQSEAGNGVLARGSWGDAVSALHGDGDADGGALGSTRSQVEPQSLGTDAPRGSNRSNPWYSGPESALHYHSGELEEHVTFLGSGVDSVARGSNGSIEAPLGLGMGIGLGLGLGASSRGGGLQHLLGGTPMGTTATSTGPVILGARRGERDAVMRDTTQSG